MLDKKALSDIKERMDMFDNERDNLIKRSRDVVTLSKQIIYAVHRDDIKEAEKCVAKIKKALAELDGIVEKSPKLVYSGSFKVAVQEYVEAICYYEFATNRKIPSHTALNVGGEYYLLGICDLTGELGRKAVNDAINGKFEEVLAIKELVAEIYGEMLKFDFRDNEIRKKFDSIKYDLKKLEDMVFEIKVKGKL